MTPTARATMPPAPASNAAADQLGHSDPSMTQARYFGRRISTGAAGVLEAIDGAGFVV